MNSAQRTCLTARPPESEAALEAICAAMKATFDGASDRAAKLISEANQRRCYDWFQMVVYQPEREGRRLAITADETASTAATRMPGMSAQRTIFARDGWRCRYCGARILPLEVRSVLSSLYPAEAPWPSSDRGKHAAFLVLNGCIDHVKPFSRGGDNDPANLVAACWPCNFAKSNYSLAELDIADPRERAAIVDEWDGLCSLLPAVRGLVRTLTASYSATTSTLPKRAVGKTPGQPTEGDLSQAGGTQEAVSIRAATHNFDRSAATADLRAIVDDLRTEHVWLSDKKALVVNLRASGQTFQVLGVDASGEVEAPWLIGQTKEPFKAFALALHAFIPGSSFYETEKMWRVRGPERRPLTYGEFRAALPVLGPALAGC
jgi:hypothetical protein